MKGAREILTELFDRGWAVDECLDPTPEETYVDQALTDLSELVMGEKKNPPNVLVNKEYNIGSWVGYNQAITDIAKLLSKEEPNA